MQKKVKLKAESDRKNSQEKINLLSKISYGIRTPLNSIMGFSKLLVQRDLDKVAQKEYAKRIIQSSNSLLQFIEKFIDENDVLSLKYKEESINLNKFLWEFSQEYKQIYNEDLNIILVWDSKIQDFKILTDRYILKKLLILIIDFLSENNDIDTLELGFELSELDRVRFNIVPIEKNRNMLTAGILKLEINEENISLINQLINLLKGEMNVIELNSSQKISFEIPLKYEKNLHSISV